LGPGGVTFVPGRNARGTSVTFRIAWRSRAIRAEPELFLEQMRDLLQVIATEATTYYEEALVRGPAKGRRRRGRGVAAATEAWRDAIARDEEELESPHADTRAPGTRADALPEAQNPMPVPPSQRRPGDAGPAISPRLLAGLSIPMLAERLKRRPAEYQQLESHVSDVERQADDARRRVRELLDAEESEHHSGAEARRRPSASPEQS
jgi:hypothetical protein